MSNFKAARNGVSVRFDEQEAEILRNLTRDLRSLLEEQSPGDAVLERLFPEAYEGAEEADAYKELVGDDLQRGKLDALDKVQRALGERGAVRDRISREEAEAWLTALTDMRLALGTRLGVTEETMAAEIDADELDSVHLAVLHWLGWLQESLLRQVDPYHDDE